MNDVWVISFIVLLTIIISYLVIALIWWIFLWSFNFPIIFAWKQTIGIWLAVAVFMPKNYKGK